MSARVAILSARRLVAIGIAAAPVAAHGQTVTNTRTGVGYSTFAAAIPAANAGDTLELDGALEETVVVDRDLTIVGVGGAAEISSADASIVTLDAGVVFTLDDVDLIGTGDTRGLTAEDGGNTITLTNLTVDTGSTLAGVHGGGLYLIDPATTTLTGVTFRGTPGRAIAQDGGAIYATSYATNVPMVLTDVTFDETIAAGNGGALATWNIALTCVRCRFDHTEGGFGGAFYATDGSAVFEQSMFCGTVGVLGGAIFSSGTTDVRSSVFAECEATIRSSAIYAQGGDWTVVNDHFLGNADPNHDAIYASPLTQSLSVKNTLLYGNVGTAVTAEAGLNTLTYNWFEGNTADASVTLDATNIRGGDPQIVSWSADANCDNDELWPVPIVSPLLDAGDPIVTDPDNSRSDIGAFGGAWADPYYHTDHDGDGPPFLHDCDDFDGANFPGNPEVCDAGDNDCDTDVDEDPIDLDTFHADCDGDGQGTEAGTEVIACFAPDDPPLCGGGWSSEQDLGDASTGDCDDDDASVYVGAPETCSPVDQDCDGDATAGAVDSTTYYEDNDGDGFGTVAAELCADTPPTGYAVFDGDCLDQDEDVHPGADDPCGDGVDSDCTGYDGTDATVAAWFPDRDGDGFGDYTAEAVLDCRDGAGMAYVADATDCDDGAAQVHPGAPESCNQADDDCNGRIDDVDGVVIWYADADGDGFGDASTELSAACPPEADWVNVGGDCDDGNAQYTTHCPTGPEALESQPGTCTCGGTGPGSAWVIGIAGLAALVRARRR